MTCLTMAQKLKNREIICFIENRVMNQNHQTKKNEIDRQECRVTSPVSENCRQNKGGQT